MNKRLWISLLCLCLLAVSIPWTSLALAETVTTGTVHVDDTLRVRSGAGTSYAIQGYLKDDDVVTIHETVTAADGGRWYRITKDTLAGYASADYITVNASYQTDEQFEAYLTTQGFPESYKAALRDLHHQYPQWIFKAKTLSMTWETALANESKVGKNTIQSPEAWRSMEYGAYDWNKSQYVSFDSGGWYAANGPVVAYYMDPRNWLDKTYIFQFEELSYSPDQTVAGIQAILPDALDKYAEALLNAAKQSDVSAYFLAAKIVQEGTLYNGLATGTVPGYEGYYNFFDIGAYASGGNSAVVNGAIYAKNKGWNTPEKCMLDSANMLGSAYIKLGQNTTYFQKFNVVNTTSGLYGHQYMTNVAGAASEGSIRRSKAPQEQLDAALIFLIPVYQSMPDTLAARPSTTGNNNNLLDWITVDGHTLTPTFDRYTTHYAVQVGADEAVVPVGAKANDTKNAKITGGGFVPVEPGENTVQLTVTASSGAVRVYTVTVTREGGAAAATPTVTGTTYAVGTTVTKVEPDTTVSEFINRLAVTGGTAAVTTADGAAKTSGPVGTGDILRLYSGNALVASYPIVIYGDVNGDGKISSLDLRIAQRHILGSVPINGYYLTAADVSKDGKVTSLDLRMAQRYILGIASSIQ